MSQLQKKTEDSIIKLRGPKKYHVIMLNDNVTPMDFVIQILVALFNMQPEQAMEKTMEIHESGRGIAGTYSFEVAEQKCVETITEARRAGFPLDVVIEEAE